MELSLSNKDFLNSFDKIVSVGLDEFSKYKLNLFVLKVNANEFDYKYFEENLLDPVIDFSLSRKIKEKYKDKPAALSKKARQKFRNYLSNKGELGEFLLYCFLEAHLKAPKILSKLELKTAANNYVNGSDGVHFLRLENGDFQLIFGESKMELILTTALTNAFKSIYQFKNEINDKGNKKSGLPFEKSLISDQLEKETFTEAEETFLDSLIFPKAENDFNVDHSFGIFSGYEITISKQDKILPNEEFRKKIKKQIETEVLSKKNHIIKQIEKFDLAGHNFYIYIIPFTEMEKNREKLQKGITE